MEISGSNSKIITLTGYIFGANRNIAVTGEALAPLLKKIHFAEIRFKLNKETDNYKFYKLNTPEEPSLYGATTKTMKLCFDGASQVPGKRVLTISSSSLGC